MVAEPSIWPDALNKFSQLTPWAQVTLAACASLNWLGMLYFLKEALTGASSRSKNAPPIDE